MKALLLAMLLSMSSFAHAQEQMPDLILAGVYGLYLCDDLQAILFVYRDGHVEVMPPAPEIVAAVNASLPAALVHSLKLSPEGGCPEPVQ